MADLLNCGKIFIAGTGRSGTSHLIGVLGSHPDIYHVPMESRFLIDPDGLEDLVSALTDRHTPYHADMALKRFDALMRSQLASGASETVFKNWHLDRRLGTQIYFEAVNDYIAHITAYEFNEAIPVDIYSSKQPRHWPSQQRQYRRVMGKYFKNRADLIQLTSTFVNRLFAGAAKSRNKSCWCEKTPLNLLSLRFLWELFPDAAVVHIKRDPRGVLNSLVRQSWAPNAPADAMEMLGAIYDRWAHFKRTFDFTRYRYLELKLEDIAKSPTEQLDAIQSFLGVRRVAYNNDSFRNDAVNNWQGAMNPDLRGACEEQFAEYFRVMDYQI